MPQSKEEHTQLANAFAWGLPPVPSAPLVAILAEMQSTLLESMATAQKEWSDFMHRRVKEDVAASRQLMSCGSLAEMHHVYSQYLATVFQQYQQQSEKVIQAGRSMAQHLASTSGPTAKEAPRAQY
jgi:hypothetical protein